jgi:hypothetical protein
MKLSGNYYKPSWNGTDAIDWSELGVGVRAARQGKPTETGAQIMARERRREIKGERRYCNRKEA